MHRRQWCPRCGQGWVKPYRVRGGEISFLLCEECDATWTPEQQPERGTFRDLSNRLNEAFGTTGQNINWWTRIEEPPEQT